jgi:hypothetical protein
MAYTLKQKKKILADYLKAEVDYFKALKRLREAEKKSKRY